MIENTNTWSSELMLSSVIHLNHAYDTLFDGFIKTSLLFTMHEHVPHWWYVMESKLSLALFLLLFCLFLCLRNPLLVHSQNWIYWQGLAKLMQKRPSLEITPNSAGKPLLDTPMTFLWWWSWEGVWYVRSLRVFKHRKIIDKFGPCLSWKHSKHPNFLSFFLSF